MGTHRGWFNHGEHGGEEEVFWGVGQNYRIGGIGFGGWGKDGLLGHAGEVGGGERGRAEGKIWDRQPPARRAYASERVGPSGVI